MFGVCEPPYTAVLSRFDSLESALCAAMRHTPDALVMVLGPTEALPFPPAFNGHDALVLILSGADEGAPLRALPEGLLPPIDANPGPFERLVTILGQRVEAGEARPEPAVGRAVIRAGDSLLAALALPFRLRALALRWRDHAPLGFFDRRKARALGAALSATPPEERPQHLLALAGDSTVVASLRAQVFARAARDWRAGDARNAARAALLAHAFAPSPRLAVLAALRAFDAGELSAPAVLLAREVALEEGRLTPAELRRAQEIAALATMKVELPARAPAHKGTGPLLYVAASAQPYHVSGYTQRTQAVLRAMQAAGVPLAVATRPGYPQDRPDRLPAPLARENVIDGVRYHHIAAPTQLLPLDSYISVAAEGIEALARKLDARRIWAASNHVNALPALVAARRLGLPFTYELRGVWEYSRASKLPGFSGSDRFNLGITLEAEVARAADRLVVISGQLAAYARDVWGVPEARIALLPNCVALADIADAGPAARAVRPVIGYLGSLVPYEGLETLVEAAARLKAQGLSFEIRIIGEGESRAGLQAQVARLGLADVVCLPGRIPPAEARAALNAIDIVAIPRLPFKVCEMVPPLKLVEALAAGKPVLVPDLPVFRDEAGDAALYFTPSDSASLAQALADSLADAPAMVRLSQAARARVRETRVWQHFYPVLRDI